VRAQKLRLTFVPFLELLARSDILLVHVPLTAETRDMVDTHAFQRMERKPILVNTARGEIIEPKALARAVDEGQIRGLGLDVLWQEPPDWDDPIVQKLLASKNVLLSPHCASHTREAFRKLTSICIDNVEAFLRGAPANVLT
jgi:glycerate dehydrogenase